MTAALESDRADHDLSLPGLSAAPVTQSPTKPARPRRRARIAGGVMLAVLLATELILALPYAKQAAPLLEHAHPGWLVLALVSQAVSMAAFGRVQNRMLAAGGTRVPQSRMLAMTFAANAMNASLPAGAILSTGYAFRRLRAWGTSAAAASFTLLASGALSTVTFAGLAVAAAVTVGASQGNAIMLAVPGVTICAAIVAGRQVVRSPARLVHWLDRPVRAAYHLARHDPSQGHRALVQFVERITDINPRRRDWAAGLALASLNWIADLGCLAATCRTVGLDSVGTGWIALAYVAATSVSTLPLLPGGIGTVDAAMVLVLVRGGVHVPLAAAAVVLYRLISFLLVVTAGWMLWVATRDRAGEHLPLSAAGNRRPRPTLAARHHRRIPVR